MNIKLLKSAALVSVLALSVGGCISAKTMPAPVAQPAPVAMVDGDDDGDGVLNSMDECPGTPAGASVDYRGCEILAVFDSALFAFDSAELKPAAQSYLSSIAPSLAGRSLTANGHTDSVGSDSYNMGLSERRAQSVANYLAGEGVGGISAVGYGENEPVADNGTAEGRAMNRRVEISTSAY